MSDSADSATPEQPAPTPQPTGEKKGFYVAAKSKRKRRWNWGGNRRPSFGPRFQLVGLVLLALLLIAGIVWGIRSLPARGMIAEIETSEKHLTAILADPDGRRLYVGGRSGAVYVINLETRFANPLERLLKQAVTSLSLSEDGFLVATTAGGEMAGWQVDGTLTHRVPGVLPSAVAAQDRHPDRFELLFGLQDGRAVRIGTEQWVHGRANDPPVTATAWLPSGEEFVTGDNDGTIAFWTLDPQKLPLTYPAHKTTVSRIALAPDGQSFASADWNGRLHIWNVDDQTRDENRSVSISDAVADLAWTPYGLLAGSWDGTLTRWRGQGNALEESANLKHPVLAFAPLPNSSHLAVLSGDGTVRIWNLTDIFTAE